MIAAAVQKVVIKIPMKTTLAKAPKINNRIK